MGRSDLSAENQTAGGALTHKTHLLVSIFKVFAENVKAISIDGKLGPVSYAARNRVLACLAFRADGSPDGA
jgi:hypothetical protein